MARRVRVHSLPAENRWRRHATRPPRAQAEADARPLQVFTPGSPEDLPRMHLPGLPRMHLPQLRHISHISEILRTSLTVRAVRLLTAEAYCQYSYCSVRSSGLD